MRKLLLFTLLLSFGKLGFSQCSIDLGDDILQCNGNPITLVPIYSGTAAEDSLRIVYDASQGVSGLVGASEVYMHSGIQTVPFGGWENTIGNWAANDGLGQMISLGNNMWQITIHVANYYGYAGGTNVIGLWMVFRNGDGSATGKDDNDEDIFVETSNGNASTFGGVVATDIPGSEGGLVWNTLETTETITVTQTGTYTVTFTDGVGCSTSDDIYVEFGSGSVAVNLGADTVICNGQTVTLDAGAGFTSYEWSTMEVGQTLEVGLPGDYAVTVTDASGCTGIDLIHVDTAASPIADFTYAGTVGTTVEFTDNGMGATTIYWDFDGDGNVDETTVAGASVEYDFGTPTVYGVTMIAENGCGTDTSSQNVLVQNVGVEELKNEIGFAVYPNPASQQMAVSIADVSISILRMTLTDIQGRSVSEIPFISNTQQISLSKLPKGIYVLQVTTSKGIINEQIIKQ